MFARIPGPAFLWFAVLVFAASNSVVRLLSDLGAQNAIDGRNAISFCNLLFAGNACAVVALSAVYRKQWTVENLRLLSKADWTSLLVLALLTSFIAPWFFFVALENTMVTSVVLVSQIEAPIMLALSSLVFGERLGPWAIVGAALCVLGVSLTLLLQPAADSGFMIGKGEFFAAAAAVIYAVSTVIARPRLKQIPVGIFVVFRNGVGTVAFFIAATYLYGPEHFIDLASPFLWKWMLVYGGIIIVIGQLAWYTGLGGARAVDVSLATSATPIAGVLGAFLILGEHPLPAQYAGGAVVVVGILIGLLGGRSKTAAAKEKLPAPPAATGSMLQSECRTGFRGV